MIINFWIILSLTSLKIKKNNLALEKMVKGNEKRQTWRNSKHLSDKKHTSKVEKKTIKIKQENKLIKNEQKFKNGHHPRFRKGK